MTCHALDIPNHLWGVTTAFGQVGGRIAARLCVGDRLIFYFGPSRSKEKDGGWVNEPHVTPDTYSSKEGGHRQ